MKCAIYSAGPSMRGFGVRHKEILPDHIAGYDVRIGINSSICELPNHFLHWYAAGDAGAYRSTYTTNRPTDGWCCLCESFRAEVFALDIGWEFIPSRTWSDLPLLSQVCSPSYSITGALALAADLGATSIDIYGHDCAVGEPNANGVGSDCYPNERAKKEASEVTQIISLMLTLGITTNIKTTGKP